MVPSTPMFLQVPANRLVYPSPAASKFNFNVILTLSGVWGGVLSFLAYLRMYVCMNLILAFTDHASQSWGNILITISGTDSTMRRMRQKSGEYSLLLCSTQTLLGLHDTDTIAPIYLSAWSPSDNKVQSTRCHTNHSYP